jgi:hypothetical protein
VVEHQLPKLSVVGSIPIARSKPTPFRSFGWRATRAAMELVSPPQFAADFSL